MIAADVYKEFDDVGFENKEKIAVVGKRFVSKCLIGWYDRMDFENKSFFASSFQKHS